MSGRLIPTVLTARALRGWVDGLVSVVLVVHLRQTGFSATDIGAIVTATLLGSAGLTLAVGLRLEQVGLRPVLLTLGLLMVGTGVGFMCIRTFWPLLVIALVGTLNPSAGDVTPFLPVEQTLLAGTADERRRPLVYAWYNLSGAVAGAFGSLAVGVPIWVASSFGLGPAAALEMAFVAYVAVGVIVLGLYATVPLTIHAPGPPAGALATSRRTVSRLAALFSLDAFGGGFVVQAMLVLWLTMRFGLAVESVGLFFFVAGLLGAISQLASAWLSRRIGLVRTMVFTHLPANLLLVVAGVVPHAGTAMGCLLGRALLSQMDVPVRQAYVMAVVPPHERAAAASVTAVPRSLAAALPALLAGAMLEGGGVGWPLVIAGSLKALYDLLLLRECRAVGTVW